MWEKKVSASVDPIFIQNETVPNSGYQYMFLGQERQDELGLNWDTFRYRNYDSTTGRFMGVDPISEEYLSISPYQFAHNNPVWKIELEGLEGVTTTNDDIINNEPIRMTIINTIKIQSSKEQHSRPGVSAISMGFGSEKSKSINFGTDTAFANVNATAYDAHVCYSVCVDGERIEYGVTIAQVQGSAGSGGQNLIEGEFATFNGTGSYNLRTGDQEQNIEFFNGSGGFNNGINNDKIDSRENDLVASFSSFGAYIKLNLTEVANAIKDTANLLMSYMQAKVDEYWNGNISNGEKIKPIGE